MPVLTVREVDMGVVLFCFMGLTAGVDLLKGEIPDWMFWLFGAAGAVGTGLALAGSENIAAKLVGVAGSMAVGAVILLVSHLVKGAVGEGDGWFFLVTGLYTSWELNLGLLFTGLMLCCVYGMVLIIWGRIKGVPVRKQKIPFLPFVWLAGMMLLAGQIWEI